MNFINKLFHKHIWKTNKEELIRIENAVTHNCEYRYYAQYQKCIICPKERISERKKLFIRED